MIDDLLDILADNVKSLMDARFKQSSNKPLDLGKASGIGKATVQRILKGANKAADKHPTPNIRQIVALSWALDAPLQSLLTARTKRARLLQPIQREAPDPPESKHRRPTPH